MPFEHLPLLQRYQGQARLKGFGTPSPQTVANRAARDAHSSSLLAAGRSASDNWRTRQETRDQAGLPTLPAKIPLLLQVDPSLELDYLRTLFDFEIVSEQEDGYVIVASGDIDLTKFQAVVEQFAVEIHGSAKAAQVHTLHDDPQQTDRLARLLADGTPAQWNALADDAEHVIDVGVSCPSTVDIPNPVSKRKRETDADWAKRQAEWSEARTRAYETWDEVKREREADVERFVNAYNGSILHLIDGAPFDAGVLPDSFTVRIRMLGRGIKDFVLNYPYVFEVVAPDVIAQTPIDQQDAAEAEPGVAPVAPEDGAPAVCVIDSGIQENHTLLQPGIDSATSYCFVPGKAFNNIADEVPPGGHGTRVAGAILYGEAIALAPSPQLDYWIQNARVLDETNSMPIEAFPPQLLRAAVERFHLSGRRTRIFNHSINSTTYCRLRHMSAWAAEIDNLCSTYDVLIIQSAGNLLLDSPAPHSGISQHLANSDYPDYLVDPSCRVANPAQSLQALTVGSVGYGAFTDGAWSTFSMYPGGPSGFSRTGPAIWNVNKPEVVEFGGDSVRSGNTPPDVQSGGQIPDACPNLVRSTLFPPGPALDRDAVGTSFAAPKVARIAAALQKQLPDEPTLLYRALIVQSARWPGWADDILGEVKQGAEANEGDRELRLSAVSNIFRTIGFGIPDIGRATTNDSHRSTFVTSGEESIRPGECHIFQVPIPPELRSQADDFDIRIDVTLSYCATPRRTRRNLRRYLSTWVDWKSIRLGESLESFRLRAIKETDDAVGAADGAAIQWTLGEGSNQGYIRNTKRNNGTAQKDWAIVKSNALPADFCIAVVGHQGWSRDPDSTAKYTLAVTLTSVGQEIEIYEPLRASVLALEAELEAEPAEAEVEV